MTADDIDVDTQPKRPPPRLRTRRARSTKPAGQWVIALPTGGWYWEPRPDLPYRGPDRFCCSALAAKKFDTREGAARVAASIPGATVKPFDADRPWLT